MGRARSVLDIWQFLHGGFIYKDGFRGFADLYEDVRERVRSFPPQEKLLRRPRRKKIRVVWNRFCRGYASHHM